MSLIATLPMFRTLRLTPCALVDTLNRHFIDRLSLYIVVRWSRNRVYVADPQPLIAARANELADRIDPNIADIPTLSALPLMYEP